jgi:hypothetical protein
MFYSQAISSKSNYPTHRKDRLTCASARRSVYGTTPVRSSLQHIKQGFLIHKTEHKLNISMRKRLDREEKNNFDMVL